MIKRHSFRHKLTALTFAIASRPTKTRTLACPTLFCAAQLIRSGLIERHELFTPHLLLDFLLRVNEMMSKRDVQTWGLMVGDEEGVYVSSHGSTSTCFFLDTCVGYRDDFSVVLQALCTITRSCLLRLAAPIRGHMKGTPLALRAFVRSFSLCGV